MRHRALILLLALAATGFSEANAQECCRPVKVELRGGKEFPASFAQPRLTIRTKDGTFDIDALYIIEVQCSTEKDGDSISTRCHTFRGDIQTSKIKVKVKEGVVQIFKKEDLRSLLFLSPVLPPAWTSPIPWIAPENSTATDPPQNSTAPKPAERRPETPAGSVPPNAPGAGSIPLYRPTNAFSLLPVVRVVPDPQHPVKTQGKAGPPEQDDLNSLDFWAHLHHMPVFDSRFDAAAHFPLPQYGLLNENLAEEGALVYEGMRLVVAADGHYEVRFTASTPKMPVTLRLQLAVIDPDGLSNIITLPPISIVPQRNFHGNDTGSAFQVCHNGYSRALAAQFPELARATITRQGSARFGSWPEGINEFDRLPR